MTGGRREKSSLATRLQAFTLIELLVVIGIIAVLGAITFPVFARAKIQAMRSADISNMNALRSALQLYRADQGGYPPALLGYVNPYQSGPVTMTNVVPANSLKTALYPRRIDSIETLKPRMIKADNNETVHAVWPNKDNRPAGTAPIMDLNGDGALTSADDDPSARQKWGPSDGFVKVGKDSVTSPPNDDSTAANFYKVSGYEVAHVQTPSGARDELHYALFWTVWGIGGGNLADDPRQLGYTEPPESTVITWNSYFRDYDNGVPYRRRNDIVLFLSGGARSYDSRDVSERSWRVMPE